MTATFTVRSELRFVDISWTLARLRSEYFGANRSEEQFVEECRHSLCFSLWAKDGLGDGFDEPIGFARVITDYASFAQVSDFFIAEEFRGRGLSHFLFEAIRYDARLNKCTFNLFTRTPAFWRHLGFTTAEHMILRPTP